MVDDQIKVDGEVFLGRSEEQGMFRQTIRRRLLEDKPDGSPLVFLIQGDHGIGKSRFLRRLRDILASESPFETSVHTLLLDWEFVQYHSTLMNPHLNTIRVETVISQLHHAARDMGWSHHFSEYQSKLRLLSKTEEKISDLLEKESWSDQFRLIPSINVRGISALVRGGMGRRSNIRDLINSGLADVLQESPEQVKAAQLEAKTWLENCPDLEPKEKQVFQYPNHSLVKALADGFVKVSHVKPLVVLLDSYEMIGRIDPWIQLLIKHSGPHVSWAIAGDLNHVSPSAGGLKSIYQARFSKDLVTIELDSLTQEYVEPFLRSRSPDRLVTQKDSDAIYAATQGIPLVLQQTADLWASGIERSMIVEHLNADTPPGKTMEIMSQRLLIYCDDPEDRRALILLALQRRPSEIIHQAVMNPGETPFQLDRFLKRLTTRYSCIRHTGGIRLNRGTAEHIKNYLQNRRIRFSDDVKTVTTQATDAIHKFRDRLEAGFARLEDRFGSYDWQQAALDSIYWLSWHSEFQAWREINRMYVDSIAYDHDLAESILAVIGDLKVLYSRDGQRRYQLLREGFNVRLPMISISEPAIFNDDPKTESQMITELDQWLTRYGGKDLFASERRAILDHLRGDVQLRSGNIRDALISYIQVERNLPVRGEALAGHLALSFERVGNKMAWTVQRRQPLEAHPSDDAERAFKKAIALGRRYHKNYHLLGAVQESLGKLEAALENLLQAVTLNPDNKYAWYNLGSVYCRQERSEKAIPAFQRVLEIDPRMVQARIRLALIYRELDLDEEFSDQLDILETVLTGKTEYNRAQLEALRENPTEVIEHLREAIQRREIEKEQIQNDPVFSFIQDRSEFRELIR